MDNGATQLDRLVDAVLASPKYRSVCRDFVRNAGARELAKRSSLKEAIKATKNKLYQVGGAYLDGEADYSRWLDELKTAHGSRERFLDACARIMRRHSSTRERLEVLDSFYDVVLADLPPISTVLDIACGLNPLAIPWMPLADNVEYYAYDVYQDMMGFVNEFLAIAYVQGRARACDVLQSCPSHHVDVALILKALPCLDQVDRFASVRLLDTIDADHLVVSFPTHNLRGRKRGLAVTYEARFRAVAASKNWSIKRFAFPNELVFLVHNRRRP